MRARGADPAFVTLTDCSAVPSGHLECVPEFVQRLVDALAVHAPAR